MWGLLVQTTSGKEKRVAEESGTNVHLTNIFRVVSSSGNNKKSYLKGHPSVARSMLRRPKKPPAPPFCEVHLFIQDVLGIST